MNFGGREHSSGESISGAWTGQRFMQKSGDILKRLESAKYFTPQYPRWQPVDYNKQMELKSPVR
jgi:hypothetical protein